MKTKPLASRELAKICCRALAEKKAGDLRVLDVSAQSSITNFLVLATGTSEPHLRALRVELSKALAESKTRLVGVEVAEESGWTVVDAFDVMVHLFTPDQREHYGLENLWKDAKPVPVADLLPAPPAPAPVPAPRPKPKGKARPKAKTKAKTKPKARARPKPKATTKAAGRRRAQKP
jgi:ribosome-associated protein